MHEEAIAEILGHPTAREEWTTLESTYNHDSVERKQNMKDSLRQLQKGSSIVSDYDKKVKSICDQLATIGQLVDESNKSH